MTLLTNNDLGENKFDVLVARSCKVLICKFTTCYTVRSDTTVAKFEMKTTVLS